MIFILLSIGFLNVMVVAYVIWRFGAPTMVAGCRPIPTGKRITAEYSKQTGGPIIVETGTYAHCSCGRHDSIIFDHENYPRKWEELES